MSLNQIEVGEDVVSVIQLEMTNKDVVNYFRTIQKQDRLNSFVRAVEVGTFCLERANSSQDLEFVRRQIEGMILAVEKRVSLMPSEVESALMAHIGAGDGQILAPIHSLVTMTTKVTGERLNELRVMVNEVDPAKEGSSANRIVKNLRDLLDVNRTDSIQATINAAVRSLTTADGILAKTVQSTVESSLKLLREEIDSLGKEVRGQEAAVEALNQTTAKGRSFEEELVEQLQEWARHVGASVEHVGTDNRPGDIVVRFNDISQPSFGVVIEARDRQSAKGRKAISDTLVPAMAERNASGAIYLSRDREGLANEIGEWGEGECAGGCFVACTHDHLVTALRFLAIQKKLRDMRADSQDVDGPRIAAQLTRIRTSLDRIKNINRKTTDIRGSATEIEAEATLIRSEVREALSSIEECFKTSKPTQTSIVLSGEIPKLAATA
jgi:hypothetical protein